MTKYLIRKTTKHPTRAHLVASDGKRPYCDRSNLIAGERGWIIEEGAPGYLELCWHCFYKSKREKE